MANVDYSTTGIVTKPVNLTAVSRLIGDGTNDLGKLCTSSKINKWSKHKPVIFEKLFPENDEYFATKDINDQMYGLKVKTFPDGNTTAYSIYNGNSENYSYNYMTPLSSSYPKRLGDFLGYNHNAAMPLAMQNFERDSINDKPSSQKAYVSNSSSKLAVPLRFVALCSTSVGGITLHDIATKHLGGAGSGGTDVIALVAHFHEGSTLKASYFANGIKLYTTGQPSSITDFEYRDNYGVNGNTVCRWLWVECNPDKATFWKDGAKTYDVYMTLDRVQYSSSEDKWLSTKRMAIPWTVQNHFMKKIEFAVVSRFFAPSKICTKSGVSWEHYMTKVSAFGYAENPHIQVETIKVPNEPITIYSYNSNVSGASSYKVKAKCTVKNTTYTSWARLCDENLNNLTSMKIQAASNESDIDNGVSVYLWWDQSIFEGKETRDTLTQKTISSINLDIYLVNTSTNAETYMCSFPISW